MSTYTLFDVPIFSFDFHQKHVKEINKFIQIENKKVSHLIFLTIGY